MRIRARIVYAGLALFTLWPAVHIGLVERYDLSPWKLAGWGMYSTPRFDLAGMEVYGRGSQNEEFEKLTVPTPELREEATRFLERYRWLRRLARPDAFVRLVKEQNPAWREVRVVIYQPTLDRESGMVVMGSLARDYPGSGPAPQPDQGSTQRTR
jgi:hypothetical protein